ncbi:MAG TPA: DUF1028 domain-containing protein [Natronoarchaeum rubrum]|nr:DUF1028 domain-containing protein [Natronoarchaeum rubrum]
MTFSICARETYRDESDIVQTRFGVAVTTRLPGVGRLCPFVNEHGAVATQSFVNVDLGRNGIEYLADGLAIEDALGALVNADDGAPERQLHGVGADGAYTFSGEECKDWFGHTSGDGYTVAGNLLTGPEVIEATASTYEESAHDERVDVIDDPEGSAPLAERLIDALAAGHEAGGDRREDQTVQSAAVRVARTEDREVTSFYDDLRVDATETPVADLRETYDLAVEGFRSAIARQEDDAEARSASSPDSHARRDAENGDEDAANGETDDA